MNYLLAPTEHELRKYADSEDHPHNFKTSSLPEKHGCDVLGITSKGIVGYQRKTLADLVSSLYDGRLYKELSQLHATGTVAYPFLLLEWDSGRRTSDDNPIDANITLSQLRSIISKFALSGVCTLNTYSTLDTLRCIISTSRYISTQRADPPRRPKQTDNEWGVTTSQSYGAYLLQSFPNVGPSVAKAIYTHFSGVPLAWTVSAADLATVPGIGRRRAEALIAALRPVTVPESPATP